MIWPNGEEKIKFLNETDEQQTKELIDSCENIFFVHRATKKEQNIYLDKNKSFIFFKKGEYGVAVNTDALYDISWPKIIQQSNLMDKKIKTNIGNDTKSNEMVSTSLTKEYTVTNYKEFTRIVMDELLRPGSYYEKDWIKLQKQYIQDKSEWDKGKTVIKMTLLNYTKNYFYWKLESQMAPYFKS